MRSRFVGAEEEYSLEPAHAPAVKYSADQPRVPAGNPDGGQWTEGEGANSLTSRLGQALEHLGTLGMEAHGNDEYSLDQPHAPAAPPMRDLSELARERLAAHLVDIKPDDRSLTGPDSVPISQVIENAKRTGYLDVPGIDEMHRLMNIQPTLETDIKDYVRRRDQLFQAQPVEAVPFRNLIYTQERVNQKRVQELSTVPDQLAKPVYVIRTEFGDYLMNGHHRVAAAYVAGWPSINAYVLDLTVPYLARPVLPKAVKFNPNHEPAGSPEGGQFASGDGGGGAAEARPLGERHQVLADFLEKELTRAIGQEDLGSKAADYRAAMETVVRAMPLNAVHLLLGSLNHVDFVNSLDRVQEEYRDTRATELEKELGRQPTDQEMSILLEQSANVGAFTTQSGRMNSGRVVLDGGYPGMPPDALPRLYAHEFGHLLDGPAGRKWSIHEDWVTAWREEIRTGFNPLSKYAETNLKEGFAEFAAAAVLKPAETSQKFPKAWAFWKKWIDRP